jgi:hypothetical protein
MKALATFREARSFIAGLLVGLSIVVPVFAMTVADLADWRAVWVVSAPILLACGLTLQAIVTTKARRPRTTDLRLRVSPVGLNKSSRRLTIYRHFARTASRALRDSFSDLSDWIAAAQRQ